MASNSIPDDFRWARSNWLASEVALESATRPFFDSDLVLTPDRRETLRMYFQARDEARALYDAALRDFLWPGTAGK